MHVIVGSGLTIAGAVSCLSFTRLPYFQSMGLPAAIGVLVALVAALTLGPPCWRWPAASGCWSPNERCAPGRWRRIGTAIVRWPGPSWWRRSRLP